MHRSFSLHALRWTAALLPPVALVLCGVAMATSGGDGHHRGLEALAAAVWLADGQLPPEPLQVLLHPALTGVHMTVGAWQVAGAMGLIGAGTVGIIASAMATLPSSRTHAPSITLVLSSMGCVSAAAWSGDPAWTTLALVLGARALRQRGWRRGSALVGASAGVLALPAWLGLATGDRWPLPRVMVVSAGALVALSAGLSSHSLLESAVLLSLTGIAMVGCWRGISVDRGLVLAAGLSGLATAVWGDGAELPVGLLLVASHMAGSPSIRWTVAGGTTLAAVVTCISASSLPPSPHSASTREGLATLSAQLGPTEVGAVVWFSEHSLRRGELEILARRAHVALPPLVLATRPTHALPPLSRRPAPTWAWVEWDDREAGTALAWIQDHADLEGAVTWSNEDGSGSVILPLGAHSH